MAARALIASLLRLARDRWNDLCREHRIDQLAMLARRATAHGDHRSALILAREMRDEMNARSKGQIARIAKHVRRHSI